MILTQTFYTKVAGLVAQRESQALEETMASAHSVLKQAHRRGVELEGILEVKIMNRREKTRTSTTENIADNIVSHILSPLSDSRGAGSSKTIRLFVDSWRLWSAASPLWV